MRVSYRQRAKAEDALRLTLRMMSHVLFAMAADLMGPPTKSNLKHLPTSRNRRQLCRIYTDGKSKTRLRTFEKDDLPRLEHTVRQRCILRKCCHKP